MSGINVMNIAKGGLLSHQTAIDLTGTNIANVNTPGYTRQRAVFDSVTNSTMGANQAQTGVVIKGIERIYDRFLATQIALQTHAFAYSGTYREQLSRVEVIFNNYQDGIGTLMNNFWGSLGDLSMNPTGQIERVAVLSDAQILAESFRSAGEQLVNQQEAANEEIVDFVREANGHISTVVDLNEKIMQTMAGQGSLNDLLDKRTEAINRLAELINFSVMESADGSVSLFLADGTPLVLGMESWRLELTVDENNTAFFNVSVEGSNNPRAPLSGGRIAALLEARDRIIGGPEGYLQRLDDFVRVFAGEINRIHADGYDSYQGTGRDFFVRSEDPAIAYSWLTTMAVNPDIVADVGRIAASSSVSGDGINALRMGALKDAVVTLGDRETTFNNHYATFIAGVGRDVADSGRLFSHHQSLMSQMINKREEVSGVSIDEEMINLVRFQMGYQASARLISAADELIQTLLAMTR